MRFDLTDLSLFRHVVEAGSITHGAERAHLALAAASTRIRNMEDVLGVALLALRRHSYGPLQVSFLGKAATLCLFYAFPLLLLGSHAGDAALATRVTGWAFAIWGTALYWWAAALYLVQARQVIAGAGHGEAASQQAPLAQSQRPGDDGA